MHQFLDAVNRGGTGAITGTANRGRIAERATADDDGLGTIKLDAGLDSFSKRLGHVIRVSGELDGVARREPDPGVEARQSEFGGACVDRGDKLGCRGRDSKPSVAGCRLQHRRLSVPTTGTPTHACKSRMPGSPNALTMIPATLPASRIPISTTSAAEAVSASGSTIIRGPLVAVAPIISTPSDAADCAIRTIMSVVACDEFGLMTRMRVCSARAASGHIIAPPIAVTNARRLIQYPQRTEVCRRGGIIGDRAASLKGLMSDLAGGHIGI
jgi:hypothetical protein